MKMTTTIQQLNIDILVSTCMSIVFESLKSKKKVWKVNTFCALNYFIPIKNAIRYKITYFVVCV